MKTEQLVKRIHNVMDDYAEKNPMTAHDKKQWKHFKKLKDRLLSGRALTKKMTENLEYIKTMEEV